MQFFIDKRYIKIAYTKLLEISNLTILISPRINFQIQLFNIIALKVKKN